MNSLYPFIYQHEIVASELIAPYNHMHHADILKLLELTRLKFLQRIGLPLESFFQQEMFWVIADLQVRYLREVKAGAHKITCESCTVEGKKLIMPQKVWNSRDKLAVDAQVCLMLYDTKKQRALGFSEQILQAFLVK